MNVIIKAIYIPKKMAMHSIKLPSKPPSSPYPILNLSFRIFFSAAALFAVVTMLLWAFVFTGHTDIDAQVLNPLYLSLIHI